MNKKRMQGLIFLALVMALSVSGCATSGIYSISMDYDAENAVIPFYLKPDEKALQSIIGVAEFTDTRKIEDPLVIGRVIEKGGARVLVLPKYSRPTHTVADGMRQYLRKAGYNLSGVVDLWDSNERTIPRISHIRVLIGGTIEEMEINCRRDFPTNTYTTKLKMTIHVADMQERKVVYRTTVEATTSHEHVAFSEDRLGYQASVALGDAIEKTFAKIELADKINDALSR